MTVLNVSISNGTQPLRATVSLGSDRPLKIVMRQGFPGEKGEKGNTGEKGDTGLQGPQGDDGAKGDKGEPAAAFVSAYGGSEGSNITAALVSACAAAVNAKHKRVVIDLDSISVSPNTNCQGCYIEGGNTVVSAGNLINTSGQSGIIIAGILQQSRIIHPSFQRDDALKMLIGVNFNDGVTDHLTQYAVVPKSGSGYVICILRNDVTTNGVDSLGVSGNDQTCWRVTGLLHAVEVVAGYTTASAVYPVPSDPVLASDWTLTSLSTGVPDYTSGTVYGYYRATAAGAYREYTITVPEDGYFNVALLMSSGSADDVSVWIDNVVIDASFSLVSPQTQRVIREYKTTPGQHVIRIKKNKADSASLSIVGLNFAPLRKQRTDVDLDTYGIYRNSAYLDPLVNNSANDYAIKVANTDTGKDLVDDAVYGGSYHGGEDSIATEIRIDGSVVNPHDTTGAFQPLPVGSFIIGRSIDIYQSCSISWASKITTGGSLSISRHATFILNGYAEKISFTSQAGVQAVEFYGTLFGLNKSFTHVVSPQLLDMSTLTTNQRYALGKHGEVEYHYQDINAGTTPSTITTTRVSIQHTHVLGEETEMGGSSVWNVPSSYRKYYYPFIWNGLRTVKAASAVNIIQVS